MLEALGASTDSWLLQRYLLRSLDREMVKSQDMETVIISVASNSDGQFLAWRHLKAYWPQIHDLLGNGSLSGLISVVISNFFTEYDYHEVYPSVSYIDIYITLLNRTFGLTLLQPKASLLPAEFNFHPIRSMGRRERVRFKFFNFVGFGILQKSGCRKRSTSIGTRSGNDQVQYSLGKRECGYR